MSAATCDPGPTYREYLRDRYGVDANRALTDFLHIEGGKLIFGGALDLNGLVAHYGAPLEVGFNGLITRQIARMHSWVSRSRHETGYQGEFVYAYATKANQSIAAVRTALSSGAHYETSSAADVLAAHRLWQAGLLTADRYLFCNGSKDDAYLKAIVALRVAGYERIVPIIDDLAELDVYMAADAPPFLLGVRERRGDDRFGLTPAELAVVIERLTGTAQRLVVYHAMVGSQIEDADFWLAQLQPSMAAYCRLRRALPSLHMFNIGGGMPTAAYRLDFAFDYQRFWSRLMGMMASLCADHHIPHPDLAGEFGRYTVASHSLYLFRVGAVKPGLADAPYWYLLDGSLMVALPDMLIVPGQQFLMLPLEGWDRPAQQVRLAGRHTCDSDDYYPRAGKPALVMPANGRGLTIAVFGVGAYQQALSGRGGVHHCLAPEMRRINIDQEDDALVIRETPPQSYDDLMALLGYDELVPLSGALPAAQIPRIVPLRRLASSMFTTGMARPAPVT